MKVVFQALIGSSVIHLVYMVSMALIGYIKTRNYKPDVASAWDEVGMLQNEVVFSKAGSPFLYLFTFIGVTAICGVIIFLYKKLLN